MGVSRFSSRVVGNCTGAARVRPVPAVSDRVSTFSGLCGERASAERWLYAVFEPDRSSGEFVDCEPNRLEEPCDLLDV